MKKISICLFYFFITMYGISFSMEDGTIQDRGIIHNKRKVAPITNSSDHMSYSESKRPRIEENEFLSPKNERSISLKRESEESLREGQENTFLRASFEGLPFEILCMIAAFHSQNIDILSTINSTASIDNFFNALTEILRFRLINKKVRYIPSHFLFPQALMNKIVESIILCDKKYIIPLLKKFASRESFPQERTMRKAQIGFIKQFFNKGPIATNGRYCYVLILSARRKHDKLTKILMEYGAAGPIVDSVFARALFFIDMDTLDYRLRQGYCPDDLIRISNDGKSYTTLMVAVWMDNLEIFSKVLEFYKGRYDINKVSANNSTALEYACYGKHNIEMVKSLLENGANANVMCSKGIPILIWAVVYGYKEIVCLLLDYNANPNIVNSKGATPLMFMAAKEKWASNDENIVKLLLIKGALVNIEDTDGHTPLLLASNKRNYIAVKIFLEHNACHRIPNLKGGIALMIAVGNGDVEIVELLLNHDGDQSSINKFRETPLIMATRLNFPAIVKLLLKNITRSILLHTNDTGESALTLALMKGHTEIFELLRDKYANLKE